MANVNDALWGFRTDDMQIRVTAGLVSMMSTCACGDVFRAHGSQQTVDHVYRAWASEHEKCVKPDQPSKKVFWMSFVDAHRPKGDQFLGACVVEVTREEAEDCEVEVLLKFPLAQPGAEWNAAATRKAHTLGCNPGGEIAFLEIEPNHPNLKRYQFGVLMDRATCERLDRECLAAEDSDER